MAAVISVTGTYSCRMASTCSIVVIPAQAKLSLYWFILMDSSHSGTDLKVALSQPLVLGRRMDTLQHTHTHNVISLHFEASHTKGEHSQTSFS